MVLNTTKFQLICNALKNSKPGLPRSGGKRLMQQWLLGDRKYLWWSNKKKGGGLITQ